MVPLFAVMGFIYSMVGHGGASGYLALMAFTSAPQKLASTTALILNLAVSGITFLAFRRARHFDWSLTWPFLVGSVPMAYLGGRLKVEGRVQDLILAATLIYAATVLFSGVPKPYKKDHHPNPFLCVGVGAAIGFLSGIVGIGGGIFLSPVIILAGWAGPHVTASIAASFIFLNSAAGLFARSPKVITEASHQWPLLVAAVIGGLLGSWLGANRTTASQIRQALAMVLLLAVVKLVWK